MATNGWQEHEAILARLLKQRLDQSEEFVERLAQLLPAGAVGANRAQLDAWKQKAKAARAQYERDERRPYSDPS